MTKSTKPHHRRHSGNEKGRHLLRGAGYKVGGDVKQDAAMIEKAISQHESHDHPGKPKTKLTFKDGGRAHGHKGPKNLGKSSRKGPHVTVIVAPQQGNPQEALKAGAIGGMMGAKAAAPHPMAAPGGPPPGAPAGMPPQPPMGQGPVPGPVPGMKKGGRVEMEGGAGSGVGRLEKAENVEDKPKARKRGGRC